MWIHRWRGHTTPLSTRQACLYAFSDDRDGVAESAYAQAIKLREVLAEIVGHLHDNRHLTDQQVKDLIGFAFEPVDGGRD